MNSGLEPTKPTREALRAARMATLKSTPSSPEVIAWVNQLAVEIEAGEKARGERARARKAEAMVSLKAALGAFLGDLLRAADDNHGWRGDDDHTPIPTTSGPREGPVGITDDAKQLSPAPEGRLPHRHRARKRTFECPALERTC